jgi:hypothetical protein
MPQPATILVVDDELGPRESLRLTLHPRIGSCWRRKGSRHSPW